PNCLCAPALAVRAQRCVGAMGRWLGGAGLMVPSPSTPRAHRSYTPHMQIVVLGAGAIGSVYGAKLSTAHDVTLVARPSHADAINTHGLKVVGTEEATYRVRATTQVESLAPDALVLLTTKVSDTDAAIRPVADLLRPATTILCVQNGLYSENVVKALVGDRCL